MTDAEHQQELELEQQEWDKQWHCIYCLRPISASCPHPTMAECCKEVGHVQRLKDDGTWEYA